MENDPRMETYSELVRYGHTSNQNKLEETFDLLEKYVKHMNKRNSQNSPSSTAASASVVGGKVAKKKAAKKPAPKQKGGLEKDAIIEHLVKNGVENEMGFLFNLPFIFEKRKVYKTISNRSPTKSSAKTAVEQTGGVDEMLMPLAQIFGSFVGVMGRNILQYPQLQVCTSTKEVTAIAGDGSSWGV